MSTAQFQVFLPPPSLDILAKDVIPRHVALRRLKSSTDGSQALSLSFRDNFARRQGPRESLTGPLTSSLPSKRQRGLNDVEHVIPIVQAETAASLNRRDELSADASIADTRTGP